ncbi:protocadherin-18 [Octopus bimaculoides]|uniref:Cadherin domain-containing protein n=1 Tax=Octopus bimaculoides TaxID=37653 RepID=A0A0L8GYF8_OCTBM|nr:protocadherin-18 [Octopus bimaculoides]|eukprot:XP_014776984.1 PREDICTED: protocadherin-18-like [Octopus bimaculoides]
MEKLRCELAIVSFALLLIYLPGNLSVDLTYHVREEKAPWTYIGDITVDSQLLHTVPFGEHNQITFDQLHVRRSNSVQLFNVTSSGKLYTAQTLDAESLCSYNIECFRIIKIAVHKFQTFMKILKVKIVIDDINDNQPEFPKKQISIVFSEGDAKEMAKPIPNAIDEDVGLQNSQIKYELQKTDNEPFALSVTKRITGSYKLAIILTQKLDRETKDKYNVEIIAADNGRPVNRNSLQVQITVTDVNDNAPVFTQNINNVSIKSTHPKDSPVVILSANDPDLDENAKIKFQYSSETSDAARRNFKLNSQTGEIFMVKNVSSGQKVMHKLLVEAQDNGVPQLSSSAIVYINIINQQNNAPEIEVNFVSELKKNTARISEDTKVGSFIAYVSVIDNDVGLNGQVECRIEQDNFLLLNLGSNEYKVTLKKKVDREIKDRYSITISCQDNGSPSLVTNRKFSIQVTDVNDVQPKFTKNVFKFLTYENERANFPIGYVNVTDFDLGSGGQLTFVLLSGINDNLPFQITDYGFISTTQSLDREKQESYKFKIFVKDNGTPPLNNTANVVVEILDQNDNAPYFTFPGVSPFSLDVHYHPQSKNDITVLRASDRDSHVNSFLSYNMIGNNVKQLFKVNPYTGVLSFARPVYQNDAGSYQLEFVVKDSGTPVLSATTTVSLTLTVSNKTSPMLAPVHMEADNMINITWVIVIVTTAVVVSVAVVITLTVCIVRCNNQRHNSHLAGMNAAMPAAGRDKSHFFFQPKKPVPATMLSAEMRDRSTQLMEPESEFYPQYESQSEWTTSTADRRQPSVLLLPTRIQKC